MKDLFTKWNNAQYKEFELNWKGSTESLNIYFILGKFSHYCEQLMNEISMKLNLCGWQFKLSDINYSLYCDYQEYDRLWHLMVSYRNMEYNYTTTVVANSLVNDFKRVFKEYDFMSSQEYETIMKQYYKAIKLINKYL